MDESGQASAKGEISMKTDDFEGKLISARPDNYKINRHFTDNVMKKLNSAEIILASTRNMNVTKKETFIMKIKHLPKLAIIAIAAGTLLILSGTAYATYQLLWPKPSVELTELNTSISGREEALLSTKECGPLDAQRYELKRDATITADRIPAIVRAQCELTSIQTWAQSTFSPDRTKDPREFGESYVDTAVRVSMATKLDKKSDDSITFKEDSTYGQGPVTFGVTKNIKYIVDGKEGSASSINTGDAVVYVVTAKIQMNQTSEGSYSGGGMPEQTLVAVVKLTMPFEDYDQFAWQSLSQREACYGNPAENCVAGGASIDLYMGNLDSSDGLIVKEIQGVVTALNGTKTSIRSSSGTIYTINTPTDVISSYNKNKATQYYNNQKVEIGNSLSVKYSEREDENSKDIKASNMVFMIEIISKGDPVKAY